MIRRVKGVLLAGVLLVATGAVAGTRSSDPEWSLNATIIEACTCPMFCQCYFNPKPAAHGHDSHGEGDHFCKFNNAFRVNKGNHGSVSLDGARFWVAGDLGGDFSMGQMDWAVLTFDPSVTKEQREGIQAILAHVYPVKWNSFQVAKDASMKWEAKGDHAEATLDGGKTAQVTLHRAESAQAEGPVVIKNLTYWGVPRNDGFVLMPNQVQAYRAGQKAFESKGTNGFMITIDISSKDVKKSG